MELSCSLVENYYPVGCLKATNRSGLQAFSIARNASKSSVCSLNVSLC